MYLKIFYPIFFLITLQVLGFFIYNGFQVELDQNIVYLVIACYLFTSFAILLFCFNSKNSYDEKKPIIFYVKSNREIYLNFLLLILILLFINKPTFLLYTIGSEFGFDYLRQNYYNSDSIRGVAYGNMTFAVLTQMYIVPILWFYLFLIMDKKHKFSIFLFHYLLVSLILLNLAYAGRFNIYFAFLVLYLRNVILQEGFLNFIKKYTIIFSLLFFVSMYISNLRVGAEGLANDADDFIKLLEYHIAQPYFFAQKISDGTLINDGYIFKIFLEGLFFPIYYLMGVSFSDTTIGYYSTIFGNPTLYSYNTHAYYNAFSTLYAYLFSDYGYFTPIFCFIIISYLLYSSLLIYNFSYRLKYLGYLSLMMYFSLFQAPILFPGTLLILFFYPIFFKFFVKRI